MRTPAIQAAVVFNVNGLHNEDPVLSIFIQRLLHLCGETLGFYGSSATVKRSKGRLRLDESYHFPEVKNTTKDDFYISDDETSRKVKCRPAFVAFEDGNPREEDNKLLALKQDAMQDLEQFCGDSETPKDFPDRLKPFNYIHLSEAEMASGYFAYYCLAKMRDLRLQNVKGYFVMADDTVFNFWNKVDLSVSLHPSGLYHFNPAPWFNCRFTAIVFDNLDCQGEFRQFTSSNMSAADALLKRYGWAVSDFFYIPSETLDYYSTIMEVFFESSLFHEIAMRKFLGSVPHNTLASDTYDYLYRKNGREFWHPHYNDSLIMMHPIKLSQLTNRTIRRQFCDVVVSAFKRNLFLPSM
ncbi:unnamed protein product [Nippostrongylus brasiliensis]|uniref:Glycosyltransferase family 92 protein n=1 Tax=Nippostrongylus brasiliensis TaxID=27835 RepID=A0A0N4Y9A8_NIPBR|nr:unnamed protein product [Nippostrongylus brasiliensis]